MKYWFLSFRTRRFRETASGQLGDMNTSWLSSWLGVERARESLLWVWAIMTMGGEQGVWGDAQRKDLREIFKLPSTRPVPSGDAIGKAESDVVLIKKIKRGTLSTPLMNQAFQSLNQESPISSSYRWCECSH